MRRRQTSWNVSARAQTWSDRPLGQSLRFAERPRDLIRQGADQIGEGRPRTYLNEGLDRHEGNQFEISESSIFAERNDDASVVVGAFFLILRYVSRNAGCHDQARRAGGQVAKILRGAKPGDLPIE